MHECPSCGQACDCDGDDLWYSWPYNTNCVHDCEEDEDDYFTGQGNDPDYFSNERTPMPHITYDNGLPSINSLYPNQAAHHPTVPLYPLPVELANLVAEIAIRLQTDPDLINALHIAELDIPDSDDALEAAAAAMYTLVCAQAGFHPTLSLIDVTESHT